MNGRILRWLLLVCVVSSAACGDSAPAPVAPFGSASFLAGTWRGVMTIQINAAALDAPASISGPTTWTFEVVPQTNLQTFRATIHAENAWWPVDTIATAAVSPTNTPPTQISTQGDYGSPRGCRGTFGSFGMADAAHIDADFKGADCNLVTFTGRVTLTKQ